MGIDQKIRDVQTKRFLNQAATNWLIMMSAMMAMTMVVANFCATKLWNFAGVPVDGGILLFPLTYVLGDLLVEIYGKRTANCVAVASFAVGAVTMGVITLTSILPDFPGADNGGFVAISAASGRIFLASIVAFLASQIVNNWAFEREREIQKVHKVDSFWIRAIKSSMVAHVVDLAIFEPIAFFGKLSLAEFAKQAAFAYGAAVIIEAILLAFVTKPLAKKLAEKLRFQHGERI